MFCISPLAISQEVQLKTYYDSDKTQLKEVYTLKEKGSQILHGPYTDYFENGEVKTHGQYFENAANGVWEFYYESGGIRMRGNIKNGQNQGLWEYFYENGEMSMIGDIDGGKRQGDWQMYFDNGALKSEGKFADGVKEGSWKYYFEKGGLQADAEYSEGDGMYTEYFPSGNVKMEGLKTDGQKQGFWTYYYEDGTKKGEGEYRNALKSGTWKYYNEEGNITSEGSYQNGQPDGFWVDYHENGSISSQGNYSEGQKNGSWKLFYNDGTHKGDGKFIDGTGEYFEYFKNGQMKLKGYIKDGKNDGHWTYYYENGKIEGTALFEDGVGIYTGYFPDGTIKMKGSLRNNERIGIWELFKEDGNLAGYYKPYYEDGNNTLWLAEDSEEQKQLNRTRGKKVGSYKYKKSKFDYFNPQINEFKAVIINYNPFAPALNSFPIGIEYYHQERLGHELLGIIIRDPFFRSHDGLDLGTEYKEGFELALRQKLYNDERRTGVPYFGHEVRYSNVNHRVKAQDMSQSGSVVTLTQNETKYEYSVFVGNRFFKSPKEGGMTLDTYIGAGIGYRNYSKDYQETQENTQYFSNLPTSPVSFALRLGINLGFAIRVKR